MVSTIIDKMEPSIPNLSHDLTKSADVEESKQQTLACDPESE